MVVRGTHNKNGISLPSWEAVTKLTRICEDSLSNEGFRPHWRFWGVGRVAQAYWTCRIVIFRCLAMAWYLQPISWRVMAFRRKSLLNSVCFVGVEGSGIDSIIVILLYSYFASIPMFYYVGSDVRRWLHRAARAPLSQGTNNYFAGYEYVFSSCCRCPPFCLAGQQAHASSGWSPPAGSYFVHELANVL